MLPDKGFNMPMPKSQLNSGTELDECCGDITQADDLSEIAGGSLPQSETGVSLDEVFRKYDRK